MEYYPKFKEKGIYFSIHRNKYNVGSDKNSALCQDDSSGEYVYTLASDDYIALTMPEIKRYHHRFIIRIVLLTAMHRQVCL